MAAALYEQQGRFSPDETTTIIVPRSPAMTPPMSPPKLHQCPYFFPYSRECLLWSEPSAYFITLGLRPSSNPTFAKTSGLNIKAQLHWIYMQQLSKATQHKRCHMNHVVEAYAARVARWTQREFRADRPSFGQLFHWMESSSAVKANTPSRGGRSWITKPREKECLNDWAPNSKRRSGEQRWVNSWQLQQVLQNEHVWKRSFVYVTPFFDSWEKPWAGAQLNPAGLCDSRRKYAESWVIFSRSSVHDSVVKLG